ncbi:unnamed protein product [Rhizophagus irregularis]|nr:unnamed protein product [Rhizophagus irregularis]
MHRCQLLWTARAKEAMDFPYNGFIPPTTKAKDGQFANPIHLQYGASFKNTGSGLPSPPFFLGPRFYKSEKLRSEVYKSENNKARNSIVLKNFIHVIA